MLAIPVRLLKAEEVAPTLGVPTLRVYELARTGLLPCVRLGRQVRFAPAALEAFVASGGRGLGSGEPDAA
jgi:excisionase family DNA binding protein